MVDKQCMVHEYDRKFLGQEASYGWSIMTDRYSARRCLQSEIQRKNKINKRAISQSSIVKRQEWSKITTPYMIVRARYIRKIWTYSSLIDRNLWE